MDKIRVIGVSGTGDRLDYRVLVVHKKNNELLVVSSHGYTDFSEITANCERDLPVVLVINVKGVLYRKIDLNDQDDLTWQRSIDFESLSYTGYQTEDALLFMGFCRKNVAEDITATFTKSGYAILDLFTGVFHTALLARAVNRDEIAIDDMRLHFDNGRLIGFGKQEASAETSYAIGTTQIKGAFLPLYAAAVVHFAPASEIVKDNNGNFSTEELRYKKAFRYLGISMLVFFLVSLAASYALTQYYLGQNAQLDMYNLYSDKAYREMLEMEKENGEKRTIVNQSGILSDKFLSFYAYEILQGVPPGVQLNELKVNPLRYALDDKKPVEFEQKVIYLKGYLSNDAGFNQWVQTLKKLDWVAELRLQSLSRDKGQHRIFEIKIAVK
ncbi:hypothetical protein HUK80_00050 [Flavobacterium sp. MAH-1]|uniref:Uncharacterized protein n=1 Tax=Flavobacterium agri TaxID=2743471 RepID=A0A7Y8XYY7_9FLAO|nr:hypothetical protein [Flavobacterium agri]NUY79267.1 hypothetical protein [Flavobacterium agri]NYA69291.1 hypothetical protein [Flavobacterium agri]